MQSWLIRNLEVMKKRYPVLAATLEQAGAGAVAPVLQDVVRFWMRQPLRYPLLLVCYGAGTGHHLRHYFSHPHPAPRHIVIIERSTTTFRQMLTLQDWRDVLADPRVEWIVGQSPEDIERWFYEYLQQDAKIIYTKHMENVIWPLSMQHDGPYYLAVAKAMARGSSRLINAVRGTPEDQLRGLVNMVDNIDHLDGLPYFDRLRDLCCGRPGVVVATGPSLDCALPHLSGIQGRAVVFAVDSAAAILHRAGITPHFIACLERVVATERLVAEIPQSPSWLVALPVVSRKTFQAYTGPRMLMFSRGLTYSWLFGKNVPTCLLGASSATMAFAGLQVLGCDPIILVGQDLAFDRHSQRSHAGGAASFIQSVGAVKRRGAEKIQDPANMVQANNGEPILTWEPYRIISEQLAALMRQSGRRCINAIPAEYGMRLAHAERMDPAAALALCTTPVDVFELVGQRLKQTSSVVSSSTMAFRVDNAAQRLRSIRDRALAMSWECTRFYHEHLPSLYTPELEQAYRRKLIWIEEQISTIVDEPIFQDLLSPIFMTIHIRLMMRYLDGLALQGPFERQLAPLWESLNEWFEELYVWSDRCAHLLASGVSGSRAVA